MRNQIDKKEFVYQVATDGVKYLCKQCGHAIPVEQPEMEKPQRCPRCGFEFEKE